MRLAEFAVLVAVVLSALFGFTWPSGYCVGDRVLSWMGITPWSHGDNGLHFVALISVALILLSVTAYGVWSRIKADQS